MNYVLAIDIAKNKSMVSLISSGGEILIKPYDINHTLIDFKNLKKRIENYDIYHGNLMLIIIYQ